LPRVVSVGRLDFNSEGSCAHNDVRSCRRRRFLGWMDQALPGSPVCKLHSPTSTPLLKFVIDGKKYGPIVADLERSKGIYSWASVSLKEGKNRDVKR